MGEGQKERETESKAGSRLSAQSLMRGSNPQTVRTWPEPKSVAQPTEPPRRPKHFLSEQYLGVFGLG